MALSNFMYKVVKKLANAVGYHVAISKRDHKTSKGFAYDTILPQARYAPWLADESFMNTFKIIKDNTLVDQYRCYELWQLVGEASKLKGAFIEIGVWRGGSGALIAQKAKLSGRSEKVFLCDTFKGVVKTSEYDSAYKGGEHSDTSTLKVEQLLKKLGLENTTILVGIFPEETQHLIKEDSFCFCHIDVDVYQSAQDIINWIWPKLSPGGVVIFDDYGFEGCDGVTLFVNEERKKNDRIVIHNLNGHAIIIKR